MTESKPTADDFAARYAVALRGQRAAKDRFFQSDPYSPLAENERAELKGLAYFEPNLGLRFELPLARSGTPQTLLMQTSSGDEQSFEEIGTISFEVDGQPATLHVYRMEEGGELFLPFRDATSGQESYGAGRYLEPQLIGADMLLVDFNLAYNPYCAYSEAYACPLPPLENWLRVPIRAGEKKFHEDEGGV
jgi:uncharacterized protein (DUF1684 family)